MSVKMGEDKSRKRGKNMAFALILVSICIVFTVVGQILMKYGMRQVGEITTMQQLFNFNTILSMVTNLYIVGGVLCFGLMVILWLGAMSTLDISFMYPLASLVYVLTAIIALVFLHEDINLIRWAGIFLIVGGCFLVGNSQVG